MNRKPFDVVVAGHICLDVIPRFRDTGAKTMGEIMVPGKLVNVDEAAISTGGPVSNTGLALIKLGIKTMLMGKIGNDFFGSGIRSRLKEWGSDVDGAMTVVAGENTSYTLVLAPPRIDRIFLHNPGANDTFCANDINYDLGRPGKAFSPRLSAAHAGALFQRRPGTDRHLPPRQGVGRDDQPRHVAARSEFRVRPGELAERAGTAVAACGHRSAQRRGGHVHAQPPAFRRTEATGRPRRTARRLHNAKISSGSDARC